jgi:hypothetical protein
MQGLALGKAQTDNDLLTMACPRNTKQVFSNSRQATGGPSLRYKVADVGI